MEETAERDEEEESPTSRLEAVAEEGEDAEAGAAHTFRILLSTDNHLGYKEKDPARGMTPSSHLKKCCRQQGQKMLTSSFLEAIFSMTINLRVGLSTGHSLCCESTASGTRT